MTHWYYTFIRANRHPLRMSVEVQVGWALLDCPGPGFDLAAAMKAEPGAVILTWKELTAQEALAVIEQEQARRAADVRREACGDDD
jgi:hypothetical protein